jgi:hypothetical protein
VCPAYRSKGENIAEASSGRPLGDLREPVGIVICVGDLWLASDGHAGAAARRIVTVADG